VEAFHAKLTVAANAEGKGMVQTTKKNGIKTALIRICFAKQYFFSKNGMPTSRRKGLKGKIVN
jgi:hypothetical protein